MPEASDAPKEGTLLSGAPIVTAVQSQQEHLGTDVIAAAGKSETTQPNLPVASMPEDDSQNSAGADLPCSDHIERGFQSVPAPSSKKTGMERHFDVADELRNILDRHKLQHVVMEPKQGEEWLLGGVSVLLRFDTSRTSPQLFVSRDNGSSWVPLEAVAEQYVRALRTARNNASRDASLDHEWQRQDSPQSPNQEWRPDGLPTFNDAFPSVFGAQNGASNYYASFRVRARRPDYEHQSQ